MNPKPSFLDFYFSDSNPTCICNSTWFYSIVTSFPQFCGLLCVRNNGVVISPTIRWQALFQTTLSPHVWHCCALSHSIPIHFISILHTSLLFHTCPCDVLLPCLWPFPTTNDKLDVLGTFEILTLISPFGAIPFALQAWNSRICTCQFLARINFHLSKIFSYLLILISLFPPPLTAFLSILSGVNMSDMSESSSFACATKLRTLYDSLNLLWIENLDEWSLSGEKDEGIGMLA